MEDLPLDRIAALVREFAVNDLPLGRTLMMVMMYSNLSKKETLKKLIGSPNFGLH